MAAAVGTQRVNTAVYSICSPVDSEQNVPSDYPSLQCASLDRDIAVRGKYRQGVFPTEADSSAPLRLSTAPLDVFHLPANTVNFNGRTPSSRSLRNYLLPQP